MLKFKRVFLAIVISLLAIIPFSVNAATINVYKAKDSGIKFSNYGISTGSNHSITTYKKTSNNELAYCVVISKDAGYGTLKSCNVTSNYNLIVAGQIVDYVNSKGWGSDSNKAYAYKVASLNKALGLSGSGNFSGGSDITINSIVSEGKKRANDINSKSNKDFISTTKHTSTQTLVKKGNNSTFMSKIVTITGLRTSYLNGTPKYVITAEKLVEGQRLYLYSDANGKNLIKEITSEGYTVPTGTESLSFYIKSTGANAETSDYSFSLKVTGTVTGSYSIGETYCKSGYQTLLITKKKKVSFKGIHVLNFKINKIDLTSHVIEILKVDQNGEPLAGAQFTAVNPPVTLSGPVVSSDGTSFKFTYGPVDSNNDQFYGKKYCFRETAVPDGYVPGETTDYCHTVNRDDEGGSRCLDGDGQAATTDDYCDSDIKYICKTTTTPYVATQTGTTEPTVPTGGDPTGDPTEPTGGDTNPTFTLDTEHATVEYKDFDSSCNTDADSDDGVTQKVEVEKVCGKLSGQNFDPKNMEICDNAPNYQLVEFDDGKIVIRIQNNKNVLKISKQAATGEEEVVGAKLKICTKAAFEESSYDCAAAKTVKNEYEDEVVLSWTSGTTPAEFNGIKVGDYYLVEELPPTGYKIVTQATAFKMNADGSVVTGEKTVSDNTLVLKNEFNSLTISKQDIATSKEIPGAKISICEVIKFYDETEVDTEMGDDLDSTIVEGGSQEDEGVVEVDGTKVQLDLDMYGECIPARLADGTDASWTSGTEPKVISGLAPGTYYLVERTAPNGYSTAEAILFKMTVDGTVTDKDGKSLADNKIVMKDAPIESPPTGMLPILIISGISIVAVGGIYGISKYLNKKNN